MLTGANVREFGVSLPSNKSLEDARVSEQDVLVTNLQGILRNTEI